MEEKNDQPQEEQPKFEKGQHIIVTDKHGRMRSATVRIREVRCGKPNCKKCPHKIYAYARYRDGKKVKEVYLGIAR
jgi:hypothetical protein